MFTGIVEELGSVIQRDGPKLRISCSVVLPDVQMGASIAVNGCCLTVVAFDIADRWWEADVTEESYDRTQLGSLGCGSPVNLERPLRLSDRLGGHLVQGHVDAVGTIRNAVPDLQITIPASLHRFVVEKGSITVDGVSLTVVRPDSEGFSVAVIPHTSAITTLGTKCVGDQVNIEVDVMAKYAERLLEAHLIAHRNPS